MPTLTSSERGINFPDADIWEAVRKNFVPPLFGLGRLVVLPDARTEAEEASPTTN